MMKMKLQKLIAAATAAVAAVTATSCNTPSYDPEELKSALDDLLPASYELNEIYFGEGLPATDDAELIAKLYGAFAANVKSLKYHPVDEDCGYSSIAEIKAATEEVFTEGYSAYLYELAFDGIYSDNMVEETDEAEAETDEADVPLGEGEIIESGGELSGSGYTAPIVLDVTASYARYLEQNGMLTVRLDLAKDALPLGREYDTSALTVTLEKPDYVIVSLPSYVGGVYDCDVELKLVPTSSGWRLDTPTY